MKAFLIDLALCNGCHCCQLACKDEHVGNEWLPYALSQPDVGQFWIKVNQAERGSLPKVMVTYTPTLCMHCDNAPCMDAARDGAIYRRSDGMVIIDPVKSRGQKRLVESCPYGAIFWNEALDIPQKCTACAHILDGKGGIPSEYPIKVPRCVDSCPTGAIRFGEESELRDQLGKAEDLYPEFETKPRVRYMNLPKKFIAGEIFDPIADECLQGATVIATDLSSGKVYSAETDEFGDFWLKNVETDHVYSVEIRLIGYDTKKIEKVQTNKDINLGSIELSSTRA